MKKLLLLLVTISLTTLLTHSCSEDGESIDKQQLIGTWSIYERMGDVTGVKISFDNSGYFDLRYDKDHGHTGDGRPVAIGMSQYGEYSLKKGQIVLECNSSKVFYIKIKSANDTSMDVEVDTGSGKYKVTAKKQ
ncbi:hypothetical protein [Bacteroides sp.]|uniref:hypothetical protein n=1 Tax=Bacteroides sp. TaxID=29523 RepID=UPI0026192FCD|nr:hypothetical protein [Bacteroides sp.]MDD3040900.1 hypothetical protein [Bacteroides sp.]